MAQLTVKLADSDKQQVGEIVDNLGLDIPTVTRAFYKQIIRERRVPLDLSLEPELPALTKKGLAEAERMTFTGEGESYDNAADMFEAILGDDAQEEAPKRRVA